MKTFNDFIQEQRQTTTDRAIKNNPAFIGPPSPLQRSTVTVPPTAKYPVLKMPRGASDNTKDIKRDKTNKQYRDKENKDWNKRGKPSKNTTQGAPEFNYPSNPSVYPRGTSPGIRRDIKRGTI